MLLGLGLLPAAATFAQTGPPQRDRNVIARDEIVASGLRNPLDVVARLRPLWLSNRGVTGLLEGALVTKVTGMQVMVDDRRWGGLDQLTLMDLEQVEKILYLPMYDAVTRFGSDLPFGAIVIITRRGKHQVDSAMTQQKRP